MPDYEFYVHTPSLYRKQSVRAKRGETHKTPVTGPSKHCRRYQSLAALRLEVPNTTHGHTVHSTYSGATAHARRRQSGTLPPTAASLPADGVCMSWQVCSSGQESLSSRGVLREDQREPSPAYSQGNGR